ncbi:MAG: D-glycerate dehydrogenase [Candidatus Cloacimonetes bacterium]|nr:D-glycerate dehydrogenase [Candidatus Cloacimonadota bacterium]MCF7814553.1 D-glycerate dehydrogenase [Candidatus Cloacimonadota bacterium]MCF7868839.1 D-glycerate dehydrogenase [Candidatus Cloacimonadota bacterium]MCF7884221.1 D-glycerate dehydrogenase [Candidatus Cloacimonadota bacterium]
MKPKIFVTRLLPKPAMELLETTFEVKVNPHDRVLTKDEILEGTKWCDILLCLLTDTIDAEIIKCNPKLKAIVNYAVGFNNIDVKTATKLKIPVTNTPGVLTETTADLTWSLIMSVSRNLYKSEKFLRDGNFKGWGPMLLLGSDIHGKTLGIIGAGRIGTAVAKRAVGFDMKIIYTDINEMKVDFPVEKISLDELLKEADYVTIHVPLLPETKHLIGERELKLMKNSAYLINSARGPIVDEKVLAKALKEGWIGGAGLDVYENEPEVEPELLECENAVLLPHLGSATWETRTNMGLIAAKNAIAISEGKIPPQIVNQEIYE